MDDGKLFHARVGNNTHELKTNHNLNTFSLRFSQLFFRQKSVR